MKAIVSMIAGAALFAGGVQAQSQPKEPQRIEHDVIKMVTPKDNVTFERHAIGVGPDLGVGPGMVQFVSAEASIAGKVVKNAPYSAEAVTETSQVLNDGNRISNKSIATTYRDSEGRTRRDMTMPAIGPWAASGDAPTMIWINDPVAGVNYHLDSKQKTARKMPGNPGMISFGAVGAGELSDGPKFRTRVEPVKAAPVAGAAVLSVEASSPGIRIFNKDARPPKTESLGKQAIDGIEVEGTRSTMTIPAGEIGNERDINIVNERWYSPELQTVVMSRNMDPRMAETTYKLTNIKRGDPHPSLFQVPADYTVTSVEAPQMRMIRKIEKEE
jgi:hypothetical protein